ncbi:MAG: hypothetical protein WA220_03685 [Candidatus Nitrosopolaris sp.]
MYQLRKFRITPVVERFVDNTGQQADVVYKLSIGYLIIAVAPGNSDEESAKSS